MCTASVFTLRVRHCPSTLTVFEDQASIMYNHTLHLLSFCWSLALSARNVDPPTECKSLIIIQDDVMKIHLCHDADVTVSSIS